MSIGLAWMAMTPEQAKHVAITVFEHPEKIAVSVSNIIEAVETVAVKIGTAIATGGDMPEYFAKMDNDQKREIAATCIDWAKTRKTSGTLKVEQVRSYLAKLGMKKTGKRVDVVQALCQRLPSFSC